MNLATMRAAAVDVDDLLGQAIEQLGAEHEPVLTPRLAELAASTADTYVQLARVALERFEEAARG